METIQCSAPQCPRPGARADQWFSLAGFGLDGVAHEKCVRRLYRLRARSKPLDAPGHGPSQAPLPPCSSRQCPDPLGGRCNPGYSRPVRRTIEGRAYCRHCSSRVERRLRSGIPVDAPLKGAIDDPDDTGPEPTDAEIEALFAPLNLEHANLRLASLTCRRRNWTS